ncbi:hypothetical protein JW921_01115 [Candidatus Fermentibacterales bacterium]|nr:hypothetical protein [Candidatus Fermentibacterales bacterium]
MDLFVPGRICLFGEHSDWAGGYRRVNASLEKGHAILVGTDQGLRARARPHPDSLLVTSTLTDGSRTPTFEIPMREELLRTEAAEGGFFSYVAGAALQMMRSFEGIDGIEIDNYATDLPIRKGLSSSAAACVLVVRACNRLYRLGLSRREEMELAYQGEIATPSRCGRLDQGCAYGSTPVLMVFDGDELSVTELECGGVLFMLIVDLGATKDTRKILASLHACYPFASGDRERIAQEYLGPVNRGITTEAVEQLAKGDVEEIGRLMTLAQSQFDACLAPLCTSELTAPVLHGLLEDPVVRDLSFGAKGVGSQGDGSAQILARTPEARLELADYLRRKRSMRSLPLTIGGAARD